MPRESLIGKKFSHHDFRIPRTALVVAEFEHPVTEAPMVTWFQESELKGEESEFLSASRKEFLGWFPGEVSEAK